LHVKTATTSGITNTSDVGIFTEDARGGGAIYGGVDMNHCILFRYGRDDTVNTMNYHSYGSHRFYVDSSVQDQDLALTIGSGGQVSQPVETITPSSSATVTYTVDMDKSNIQNLVCHTDNEDITINVSNMAAGKAVKLHVDFSDVSSFSSLTVNWNNNQVYEPDSAMAMVDGIGDDMINATYTNFMVDLTAYGTSASDVYGSASVFA
jgi:hypothetical protein